LHRAAAAASASFHGS